MPQVIILRRECKHMICTELVNSAKELRSLIEELQDTSCNKCGGLVKGVDVFFVAEEFDTTHKDWSTWNQAPVPRALSNVFDQFRVSDIVEAERRLKEEGGFSSEILQPIKASVLGLIPSEWSRFLEMIPVGLLNTFDPNASCLLFQDCSIPVIVFHRGLAQFIFYMNRIVIPLANFTSLGAFASGKEPFIPATEEIENGAKSALAVAMMFLGLPIERPDVTNLTDGQRAIEFQLTRNMEQFLLAHEYGHAVLGHNTKLAETELGLTGKSAQYYQRARQQEFEADAWGQDVLCGAFVGGRKSDPFEGMTEVFFAAPAIVFLYIDFLDRIHKNLDIEGLHRVMNVQGVDSSSVRHLRMKATRTHPSSEERFAALFEYTERYADFRSRNWIRGFGETLANIESSINDLLGIKSSRNLELK